MQENRKYIRNNRLAASLLLVILLFFSFKPPLISMEAKENSHIPEQILIGLQENIAANKNFNIPTNYDIGQHRIILYFPIFVNLSVLTFIHDTQTFYQKAAIKVFLFYHVPVYLFIRMFRN